MSWQDLPVDSQMATALEFAEAESSRATIRDELIRVRAIDDEQQRKRERAALRDMRKRWSERFATACATMIASGPAQNLTPVTRVHHRGGLGGHDCGVDR
jgi:hypothetical protein